MTAMEVARDIARAASAPMCETVNDLVPSIRHVLSSQPGRHFTVVIDALDEAATPKEARTIITEIIRPLVESCADLLVHVVAGTRKQDDAGDILASFGPSGRFLNLDNKEYFEAKDVAAYAHASLQLMGDERPDNPYADDEVAAPIAARIADIADGNFLIAGLVARTRGLYDADAVSPETLSSSFSSGKMALSEALRSYLRLLPPVGGIPAVTVLAALAYAEEPGFPFDLWLAAIKALTGKSPSEYDLRDFALSSAANFLIETSFSPQGPSVFRIFHQALNDALLESRAESYNSRTDERRITLLFLRLGRAVGWESAPAYLLRSLPRHASNGLVVDDLLLDDSYILHADLRRLIPASINATTAQGRDRSRLLRKTPQAIDKPPQVRVAMLSITECQENLGSAFRTNRMPIPYRATWAAVAPQVEQAALEGHLGKINGVCATQSSDAALLVTVSDDRTVRVWDASTGENLHTLYGHGSRVRAVCALDTDIPMIASISDDCILIWNARTGELLYSFEGQNNGVCGICSVVVAGKRMLAAATFEEVRILDPLTGRIVHRLIGHQGIVHAVCSSDLGGRSRLISAGHDAVKVWDAESGEILLTLRSHARRISGLCVVAVSGRLLLICGGVPDFMVDGDPAESCLLAWDLESGEQVFNLPLYEGRADSICSLDVNGSPLIAIAIAGDLQLWDLARDEPAFELWGRQQNAYAVCSIRSGRRTAIAVAGDDAVRIWDPLEGAVASDWHDENEEVYELCALRFRDGPKVAGASLATVRVWEPGTGESLHVLSGNRSYITSICPLANGQGGEDVVIGSQDGEVSLWNVEEGIVGPIFSARKGAVLAICSIEGLAGSVLAIGDYGAIRVVEPGTWRTVQTVEAHRRAINAMCADKLHDATGMLFTADGEAIQAWETEHGLVRRLRWSYRTGAQKLLSIVVRGRTLLVSANFDVIDIWDADSGMLRSSIGNSGNTINSLASVMLGDREMLATVHHDRMLRLWDVASVECDSEPLMSIPVRYRAPSLVNVEGQMVVGLSDGIMGFSISPEMIKGGSLWRVDSER
ncbi:WD40 repeat domain-containing protein [Streptomyces phaeochromogenes]|nr:WD40 repeat domain-containing protein [Streptomyces phaeochromogenes]